MGVLQEYVTDLDFFSIEVRPIASVINFDADLYSSTICALNFSKIVLWTKILFLSLSELGIYNSRAKLGTR